MARWRRVWIDRNKRDGKPGPWKRGWQRIRVVSWRTKAKRAMRWGLAHEDGFHYEQLRPIRVDAIKNREMPIRTDCSGSTTMIYRDAGRPDPNGNDYNGTGFTGTLRAATPQRKALRNARVGDFIVYGRGSGVHVVIVWKGGRNPKVWSHGQEAGPLLNDHATQVAAHGPYFTVHNGGLLR